MSMNTSNTPQILQDSLDSAIQNQFQRYRLINDVMGWGNLQVSQRIPGTIAKIGSEVQVYNPSEEAAITPSDITLSEGTVAYRKFAAMTTSSTEVVEDWLAGVNQGPDLMSTLMQSHARQITREVNSWIIGQLDSAAGLADEVAAPSYIGSIEAATALEEQDLSPSVVVSDGAKASMLNEMLTAGNSSWFDGYPVQSVVGFDAPAAGVVYGFSGDLSNLGRCTVDMNHRIVEQGLGEELVLNDQVAVISVCRVWMAVADSSRCVKLSYAA